MPVEVVEFSTRQPDVAMAVLTEQYRPERPFTFTAMTRESSLKLWVASSGDLTASRTRFGMGMSCLMAPVDYFMVAVAVRGRAHYDVGRETIDVGPGALFRYPTTTAMTTRHSGMDTTTVSLPTSLLERVAAERFDTAAGDLRFEGLEPASEAARRGWLRLARFVDAQLADPDGGAGEPLVAAALAELVATTALATFANTTMTRQEQRGPGWVAPAVVRRAVAFMQAHASLPITTSDVAGAAGVGPRALQLAFRRHLGTTPMAYLRRVRLAAAHRELVGGDPGAGVSVAGVARRWGFASSERFSAAYRREYGVAPSHTLRT